MSFTSDEVARYYDVNTRGFLDYGEGGFEGAIRRAVWGEGVDSLRQAFHFVDELLVRELETIGSPHPRILDLGCGVGASLRYIVGRVKADGIGMSNSSVQIGLARKLTPDRHRGALSFRLGDFCRDPLPDADLVIAIESFVQATDADAFLARVGTALRPGGRLVLCDDLLARERSELSIAEKRWVSELERGWHLSSLLTPRAMDRLAEGAGLSLLEDRDLTGWLDLDRPRDRAIRVWVAMLRPFRQKHPRFMNLLGGNALRQCLKRGLVRYRFRVFGRSRDHAERKVSI